MKRYSRLVNVDKPSKKRLKKKMFGFLNRTQGTIKIVNGFPVLVEEELDDKQKGRRK